MTTETKSIDTTKIVAALHIARKEIMLAMVRPMLDRAQVQELATRLGEVSYAIKKLEAME